MSARSDRETLVRLTLQFDLLQSKLLRTARALLSTEEQRAHMLRDMASRAHPATLPTLERDARHARANLDLLEALVAGLQNLSATADATVEYSEATQPTT